MWKVASIYIPSLMDKNRLSLSSKMSTSKRFIEGETTEIAKIHALSSDASLVWQQHKHRERNRGETSHEGVGPFCLTKHENIIQGRESVGGMHLSHTYP